MDKLHAAISGKPWSSFSLELNKFFLREIKNMKYPSYPCPKMGKLPKDITGLQIL